MELFLKVELQRRGLRGFPKALKEVNLRVCAEGEKVMGKYCLERVKNQCEMSPCDSKGHRLCI